MSTTVRLVCGCGWSTTHNCEANWDRSALERGTLWRDNTTGVDYRVHDVAGDWVVYDAVANQVVPTKVAAMRRMDFLGRFTYSAQPQEQP